MKQRLKEISLSSYTWMKVGGKARLFKAESLSALSMFAKHNTFFTLGSGANIVALDHIDSLILKLGRTFNDISLQDGKIIAGAAVLQSNLSKFAMENDIAGFEFFSTIPGTVGGAVAMNAGAYQSETKDLLISAEFVGDNGEILVLSNREIGFKYRSNSLPKNYVCTSVVFDASKHDVKENVRSRMAEMLKKKQESQPVFEKTAGSIFKNPDGKVAWRLIEEAGFRGFAVGKISISEKHCNFAINNGSTSGEEVLTLCEAVRAGVKEKLGISLEYEVIFLS